MRQNSTQHNDEDVNGTRNWTSSNFDTAWNKKNLRAEPLPPLKNMSYFKLMLDHIKLRLLFISKEPKQIYKNVNAPKILYGDDRAYTRGHVRAEALNIIKDA